MKLLFCLLGMALLSETASGESVILKNECILGSDYFIFQGLINGKYQDGHTSKYFYQLHCKKVTNSCEGVYMSLGKGKALGAMSIGVLEGATVTDLKNNVFEVSWGPYRKFYYDTQKGKVSYVESAINQITSGVSIGSGEFSCNK